MSKSKTERKTHWREAFKSDYLASWDVEKNIQLTVTKCVKEEAQLQRKEEKAVLYFKEKETSEGVPVKPMILNATNCKFIHTKTGLPFINDWKDFVVEIAVVENKGRIGNAHGLKITKVIEANAEPFDISFILDNEDLAFVKTQANKHRNLMNDDQKKLVRTHITKIESNV